MKCTVSERQTPVPRPRTCRLWVPVCGRDGGELKSFRKTREGMQGARGRERRDTRRPDAAADEEPGVLPRLPHQLHANPIALGVHHRDTQLRAQLCLSLTFQPPLAAAEVGVRPTSGLSAVPAAACQDGRFGVWKSSPKLHFSPPPSQRPELQKGEMLSFPVFFSGGFFCSVCKPFSNTTLKSFTASLDVAQGFLLQPSKEVVT